MSYIDIEISNPSINWTQPKFNRRDDGRRWLAS